MAGLAVSVAGFGLAVRAQQQSDTDVGSVAARLAIAVEQEETDARRQLLGGNDRTINVRFAFQPAPAHDAAGATSKGTLEHIVTYYRRLQPQRMVITGAAGSGKTVLAIELILGLLKDRPADAPVPVRMSAASLDTNRSPGSSVADWITEHLTTAYKMPDTAARQLVAARMVLPVLDGLDEMDAVDEPAYASRAGQAIRACNAYLDGQQKAAMVLTCRIVQYEALEQAREWVHDAARIQLRPVEVPSARRFLAGRVTEEARWQPVLDRMQQPANSTLAHAMSTPWRLTLAAAVYDQREPATGDYLRDPADLISSALDTDEKIRDHLLGMYILAASAAHGERYPAHRVHQWLGVLANYLNINTASPGQAPRVIAGRPLSGTDLILHELWPVAGTRLPRILTAIITATIWLSPLFIIGTPTYFSLRRILLLAFGSMCAAIMITNAATAWPNPMLLDFPRIRTSSGRRQLLISLLSGLVSGLVAALLFGFALGRVLGLVFGFGAGFAVGLSIALTKSLDTSKYPVSGPREIVRVGLAAGLATGLAAGLVMGLVFGLVAGLAFGLVGGLILGLVVFATGLAVVRYITLLLCSRRWTSHWLPWRLGAFLHWCYQAGLIRVAGIGYQFRHRELQDYLARHRHGAA